MQTAIQDPLVLARLDRRRRGNLPVRENENVVLQDLTPWCFFCIARPDPLVLLGAF